MGLENGRTLIVPERIRTTSVETVVFPPQLDIINSFKHKDNEWMGLSRIAVGEGYVPYLHDYLAKLLELSEQGEKMDVGMLSDFASDAAHMMLKDPYGMSGRAGTFNGFIKSDGENGKNLGITA